jgi:hypothetical protein
MTIDVVLSGYDSGLENVLTATPALVDSDIIRHGEVDSLGNPVIVYPNGTYEWVLPYPTASTGWFYWQVSDDGGATFSSPVQVGVDLDNPGGSAGVSIGVISAFVRG